MPYFRKVSVIKEMPSFIFNAPMNIIAQNTPISLGHYLIKTG